MKTCSSDLAPPRRRGFTLVELLVVIAILAILAGLALPALGALKRQASQTACLNQRRQFALALELYTLDTGRYVPNSYYGHAQGDPDWTRTAPNGKTYLENELASKWVPGWLEFGKAAADNTNTLFLRHSHLAVYLGRDLRLWRCPSERATAFDGQRPQPWLRTVSLNQFISGAAVSPLNRDDVAYRVFTRPGEIPNPAGLFTFMEERAEGINSCLYYFEPDRETLGNYPGYFHGRGATVAFADGHTEVARWRDARTTPRPTGQALPYYTPSSGNADLAWFREHGTVRK